MYLIFPIIFLLKSDAYVVTSHSGPDAHVNSNYSYDIMQKSLCISNVSSKRLQFVCISIIGVEKVTLVHMWAHTASSSYNLKTAIIL